MIARYVALALLLVPATAGAKGWSVATDRVDLYSGTRIELGGGVSGFTDAAVRRHAGVAGAWDLRAVFAPRSIIGLECAYVGAILSLDARGIGSEARLQRHGLEANLRLNVPITRDDLAVLPYAFFGAGYAHYVVVTNRFATADIKDDDDVLLAPFGAGVGLSYRRVSVDTRFTFYTTFDSELLRRPDGTADRHASLDRWIVTLQLGYEL